MITIYINYIKFIKSNIVYELKKVVNGKVVGIITTNHLHQYINVKTYNNWNY